MTDFNFYSETYCGSLIPADAWDAVCRDAEAQMNRYERIYHVSYPQTGSRNMAVCAMAEALYSVPFWACAVALVSVLPKFGTSPRALCSCTQRWKSITQLALARAAVSSCRAFSNVKYRPKL